MNLKFFVATAFFLGSTACFADGDGPFIGNSNLTAETKAKLEAYFKEKKTNFFYVRGICVWDPFANVEVDSRLVDCKKYGPGRKARGTLVHPNFTLSENSINYDINKENFTFNFNNDDVNHPTFSFNIDIDTTELTILSLFPINTRSVKYVNKIQSTVECPIDMSTMKYLCGYQIFSIINNFGADVDMITSFQTDLLNNFTKILNEADGN